MKCEKTLAGTNIAAFDPEKDGCVADWAFKTVTALRENICGEQIFCRAGSEQLGYITGEVTRGIGRENDFDLLNELTSQMGRFADCQLTRDAVKLIGDTLSANADDWNQHIKRKKCRSLKCAHLVRFYVDPPRCIGCEKCLKVCRFGAVAGGAGLIHVIDAAKCKNCAECEGLCDAIKRCDPKGIPPKVPDAPVPVGSFGAPPAGGGGLRGGGLRGGGLRGGSSSGGGDDTPPSGGRGGLRGGLRR